MNISRRTLLQSGAGLAAACALPGMARAAAFPERDITNIVPYNAGGMSDNLGRIIGEKITAMTGRTVINDYKPGAGGAIGANLYAGAKPDGYTIFQSTNSFYGIIPYITKVAYDPLKDFIPLCVLGSAPMVISVNPSVGVKTIAELVAKAKAAPKSISYGSSGKGTVGHLCGEWLGKKTGAEFLHVPYKGATEALQACLSNEVQIFFGPEGVPPIKAGNLVGVGVIGEAKATAMPDLQTTQEAGISGWAPRSWHTVTILSAVPQDIRDAWSKMLAEILAMPDVQERIKAIGLYPSNKTTAETIAYAKEDHEQFGAMLKEFG